MNPREFQNRDFYSLDLPWMFESYSAIWRIFKLHEKYKTILQSLEKLEEKLELCDDHGTEAINNTYELTGPIKRLMDAVEVFQYNFKELSEATWFGTFAQDIAHAYWRIEDGRYTEAYQNEQVLGQLLSEIETILGNTADAYSQGVVGHLTEFLEMHGRELSLRDVPDEYYEDVYEARDLFSLSYYSTALLVLGRAVEKALVKLGEARDIRTVEIYNNEEGWEEAKFYQRNIALHRVNMPKKQGKVLDKKDFHQIALLVDYRNNVAHSEYEEIDRQSALREAMSAFDLLCRLSEKIEYLEELPDDDIPPVEGQSAQ